MSALISTLGSASGFNMESGEGEHQKNVSLGYDASIFTMSADESTRQFDVDAMKKLFFSEYLEVLPCELEPSSWSRELLLEWLSAGL